MSVIITERKPEPRPAHPIEEIRVTNDGPTGKFPSKAYSNTFVVLPNGSYRDGTPFPNTNPGIAHLYAKSGKGVYLTAPSLREFGKALVRAADEMEARS